MDTGYIENVREKVLLKVLAFLGYRARTEKEVNQRLDKYLERYKKLSASDKEEIKSFVNDYLHQNKLVNDEEFTELFVKSKLTGKPMGKRVILEKLLKKGINKEGAQEYLDQSVSDEDELQSAIASLSKKFKLTSETTDPLAYRSMQERMGRYLISRGFSYTTARQAVDYLLKRP